MEKADQKERERVERQFEKGEEFRVEGNKRLAEGDLAGAREQYDKSSSALTMLRETFDLTGTKLSCGEGECGACTIIVDGMSVNSCIMFAADCDGREITTIEGLQDDLGLRSEDDQRRC